MPTVVKNRTDDRADRERNAGDVVDANPAGSKVGRCQQGNFGSQRLCDADALIGQQRQVLRFDLYGCGTDAVDGTEIRCEIHLRRADDNRIAERQGLSGEQRDFIVGRRDAGGNGAERLNGADLEVIGVAEVERAVRGRRLRRPRRSS